MCCLPPVHLRDESLLLLGCTFDNDNYCNASCYQHHHRCWGYDGSVDEVAVASNVPLRADGTVIHRSCHRAGEVGLSDGAVTDDHELVHSRFTNVNECLGLVVWETHTL